METWSTKPQVFTNWQKQKIANTPSLHKYTLNITLLNLASWYTPVILATGV